MGGPHSFPDPAVEGSEAGEDEGDDPMDPHHASKLAFDMDFGCQTALTGLFKTQLADGILGMDWEDTSYWKQMYDANKIQSQQFSLCYSRGNDASHDGSEAGSITLGGTDVRMHTSTMVYTGHAEDDGWYYVQVRKMYLREGSPNDWSAKSINPHATLIKLGVTEQQLNHNGIIVDSGTTDTYWESTISDAFHAAFLQLTGIAFANKAMPLTTEQVQNLPTILLQLKGDIASNKPIADDTTTTLTGPEFDPEHPYDVLLAIPAINYMNYNAKTKKFTPRFYVSEDDGSVIGGNAMMGYDILFDAEYGRLGWAESDCEHSTFLKEHGFEFPVQQQEEGAPGSTEDGEQKPDVATLTEMPSSSEITEAPSVAEAVVVETTAATTTTTLEATTTTTTAAATTTTTAPETPTTTDEDVDKKPHEQDEQHDIPHNNNEEQQAATPSFCTDNTCKIEIGVFICVIFFIGICIGKYCCTSKNQPQPLYHVEMTDTTTNGYKDDPDDAEFGFHDEH